MKQLQTLSKSFLSKLTLLLVGLFLSVIAFAQDLGQDKKVDINVNTKSNDNFLAQPWVWVVGGALFILLLIALLRPNNTKVVKE